MDMTDIIDALLAIIVAGFAYFLSTLSMEVKRLGILLNRTREEYATREELKEDLQTIYVSLRRIEDRIERLFDK